MTQGHIHTVKSALMQLISLADATLNDEVDFKHVLGNWRLNVWALSDDKFPIVTVRMGPSSDLEVAYGRRIRHNQFGQYVVYSWSAYVFAFHATTEDLVSKTAMDLADAIKTYLAKACHATSGIPYIYDMTIRESEPARGSQRISRIIIEGRLIAKRPLS